MVKATRPCPRSPISSSLPPLHAGSSCSSAWGSSPWSFRPTSTKPRSPGRSPSTTPDAWPAANATRIAGGPATQGRALAVLGADTTVVIDDAILGKPVDESDARAMLGRLAGRRHEVVTAYRIRQLARTVERAVTTAVFVRSLHPAELDAYLASGEWRGKAGAYAVQGIAAAFVTELRGSVTNVVGLPLAEVLADLQALGALPAYPRPG